jgi:DNA repair protein RecO (recombination protein O)
MQAHTEAIVVRTTEYGEGNLILVLYTRAIGKISVMARGAKKLKSRYTAVSQLFTYGEYAFYAPSQGMGTLSNGEVITSHHGLRTDLDKTAYSAYLAELVDKIMPERESSSFIFEQLLAAFEAIESDKDAQVVAMIFEFKMLQYAGYTPTLSECVECSGPIVGTFAFSARQGGMICHSCMRPEWPTVRLSEKSYKLLQTLPFVDLRRLGNTDLSQPIKVEVQRAIRGFMDAHLEVRFKSRAFLDQLHKL